MSPNSDASNGEGSMTTGQSSFDPNVFGDPDCIKCMRRKLRATCVVVFFREPDGREWRIGNFEGDKPFEAAQVEFDYLARAGVPDRILTHPEGVIAQDGAGIEQTLGKVAGLFDGSSVIAAPVHRGGLQGVRIAWRDASEPFTKADLETVHCEGRCPEMCA